MTSRSASWQLVPDLSPQPGEKRVYKRYPSSFEETDLEQGLGQIGTTHLVLAGAQTNWCIRATAYAALERGYDLTLLHDAHTTASIDMGNGSTIEAYSIIAELNATMRWLRYPGRRSSIAGADQILLGVATSKT